MDLQLSDNFIETIKKKKKLLNSVKNITTINNKMASSSQDKSKSTTPVKTVNNIKNISSKVVGPVASSSSPSNKLSKIANTTNKIQDELNKYCRTCAGLKLPLIDIFSEKGMQMRLDQQMKHLENINETDSLTTKMCMDCICDLKMSYKFFLQIKKAEIKLTSINNDLLSKIDDDKKRMSNLSIQQKKNDNIVVNNEHNIEYLDEIDDIDDIDDIDYIEDDHDDNNDKMCSTLEAENFDNENIQRDDGESIEEFDPDDDTIDSQLSQKNISIKNSTIQLKSYKNENNSKFIKSKNIVDEKDKNNETIENIEKFINDNNDNNNDDDDNINKTNKEVKNKNDLPSKITKDNKDKLQSSNNKQKNNDDDTNDANDDTTLTTVDSLKSLEYTKMQHLLKKTNKVDTSSNDDGVLYVTVAGSKPDELLLLKMKKLDKTTASTTSTTTTSTSTTTTTTTSTTTSTSTTTATTTNSNLKNDNNKKNEDETTNEPVKPLSAIELEIENYKKRREKLLGNDVISSNGLFDDDPYHYINESINETLNIGPITFNGVKREPGEKIHHDFRKRSINSTILDKDDLTIPFESIENDGLLKPISFDKLSRIKQEWLDPKYVNITKNKKTDTSSSSSSSSTTSTTTAAATTTNTTNESQESTIEKKIFEKLFKVLGDTNKSINNFYEYLKQNNTTIDKLKDNDIITLYDTYMIKMSKKKFPDLIDENIPIDEFGKKNYYECDYCTKLYLNIDKLKDHLISHDQKMLYYCEDCGDEFATGKSKRSHNVICIKRLVCKYCNFMLDSIGKKRQHEQRHCDKLWGQLCDVCGEKFKHHGTLDQHYKTQHMFWEKKHQCPKCPKKFTFKAKLSFHLKTVHTTERAYLCEDCGADFKNPASLRHHKIRKHNPVANKKECPVCRKIVPYYSLSKHMYTHKDYTIKCSQCDKMFKNTSTLRQHIRIHEDQRQYRCDICDVGFNRRDGLRLHMKVHEKNDSRAFKECSCQICSKRFPNHSLLVLHRNREHKDSKQYTCKICNRSMLSQRALNWHMSHIHNQLILDTDENGLNIHDSNEERVNCNLCDKTFKTEMILRTHMKNTHAEKSPVKCQDCNETFTSEIRLRHHAMNAHERLDGTIKCPECDKRFVTRLRLKTHMTSHSDVRPYTCDICQFNLKTKIQLIKHHQNKHSDKRPLKCRHCDWRCKQVSALVCHERTHTDERPYACQVCKQRFKYLGDKNKHERRHESLGGQGFKRIVTARTNKTLVTTTASSSTTNINNIIDETSNSCDQQMEFEILPDDEDINEQYVEAELIDQPYEEEVIYDENSFIKNENVYYQQVYEGNQDASTAGNTVNYIVDIGDGYTEEIPNETIHTVQVADDQFIDLNSGSYIQDGEGKFYLPQEDANGKIQFIQIAVGNQEIVLDPTTIS